MIMTALVTSSLREEAVDFTFPVGSSPLKILIKVRQDSSLFFLNVFHWQAWLTYVGSAVFMSGFLWCSCKISATKEKLTVSILQEIFFFPVRDAFHQSGPIHIFTTGSTRFLSSFWWICVVIVVATYTGNLIASLATNKPKMPFNTLQELADQSTYRPIVVKGAISHEVLQRAKSGPPNRIWNKHKNNEDLFVSEYIDGIRKMSQGPYAFIGFALEVELLALEQKDCSLKFISEALQGSFYGPALPEDSPFYNRFSQRVQSAFETGLIQFWIRKYGGVNLCSAASSKAFQRRLLFSDVYVMFCLLAIGLLVASVTFVIEMFFNKIKAVFVSTLFP